MMMEFIVGVIASKENLKMGNCFNALLLSNNVLVFLVQSLFFLFSQPLKINKNL